MISSSYQGAGLAALLDEKSLAPDQRRKIAVTSAVLDLIAIAIANTSSGHKLAEEMGNLPKYVAAVEASLPPTKR